MFKRILLLILSLSLILGLFSACGNTENVGGESGDNSNNSSSASSSTGSSSSTGDEKFVLTHAKPFVKFDNETDVVICWGDSLTQGMSMAPGYTYPQQLQGDLNGQYKVINAGVPGENSNTISARANVIQAVLTNDIVFESGKSSVELNREFLSTATGEKLIFKGFGNQLDFSQIIINGEKYTVTYKNGEHWDEGVYTITRQNAGAKHILKKGTAVKIDYTGKYGKNYCNVILMGANDSGVSVDELIKRYKKLGESSDKYICIIPYYTEEDVADKFKAAFGKNALDMRDYYVNHAHTDYDLEVTKLDEWCIKKGKVPATFCLDNNKDDCHLSSIGYKVLADQVYKKGVELGYWK